MTNNTSYPTYLNQIAAEIAELASKPEDLRAILLQGSVAKGIADEYSDIELKLIWATTTESETRSSVFNTVPKEPLFAEEQEDGEWVSAFTYKSVKIDVSHLEMPTLSTIIGGVMESRDTSIASQALLASIQDSIALYGQEALDEINNQFANYPKELSTRCVQVNASFSEWSMRYALLERQDIVAFHHLIDLTLLQTLRLLFALNQTYLRSYNFKWFRYSASKLMLKPTDFEDRVETVLAGSGSQAIEALDSLLHEVFELVQTERPDLDMAPSLAILGYIRQKLEIDV